MSFRLTLLTEAPSPHGSCPPDPALFQLRLQLERAPVWKDGACSNSDEKELRLTKADLRAENSFIRIFGRSYPIDPTTTGLKLSVHARVRIVHTSTEGVWAVLLHGSASVGPVANGAGAPVAIFDVERKQFLNLDRNETIQSLSLGNGSFHVEVAYPRTPSGRTIARLRYLSGSPKSDLVFWELVACEHPFKRVAGDIILLPGYEIGRVVELTTGYLTNAASDELTVAVLPSGARGQNHVYYRTKLSQTEQISTPAIVLEFRTRGASGETNLTRWSPISLRVKGDGSKSWFSNLNPFTESDVTETLDLHLLWERGDSFLTKIVSFSHPLFLLGSSSLVANGAGALWQYARTELATSALSASALPAELLEVSGSWVRYRLNETTDPKSASPELPAPNDLRQLNEPFRFAAPLNAPNRAMAGFALSLLPRLPESDILTAADSVAAVVFTIEIAGNLAIKLHWSADASQTDALLATPEVYALDETLPDPLCIPASANPLERLSLQRLFFRSGQEEHADRLGIRFQPSRVRDGQFTFEAGNHDAATPAVSIFRAFGRDLIQPISPAKGNLVLPAEQGELSGRQRLDPAAGTLPVHVANSFIVLYPKQDPLKPLGKVSILSAILREGRAISASFPWLEWKWAEDACPHAPGDSVERHLFHRNLLLELEEYRAAQAAEVGRADLLSGDDVAQLTRETFVPRANPSDSSLSASELAQSDGTPTELKHWLPGAEILGGRPQIVFRERDSGNSNRPLAKAQHGAGVTFLKVQYSGDLSSDFLCYRTHWYSDVGRLGDPSRPRIALRRRDLASKVKLGTTASILSGTSTLLDLNAVVDDPDGWRGSSGINIPADGRGEYVITAIVNWPAVAQEGSRKVEVKFLGTTVPPPASQTMSPGAKELTMTLEFVVLIDGPASVVVEVFQDSTVRVDIDNATLAVVQHVPQAVNSATPLLLRGRGESTLAYDNFGVQRRLVTANSGTYVEELSTPDNGSIALLRSLSFEGSIYLDTPANDVYFWCRNLKVHDPQPDGDVIWYQLTNSPLHRVVGDLGKYRLRRKVRADTSHAVYGWPVIAGVPIAPVQLQSVGLSAAGVVVGVKFQGVLPNPRDLVKPDPSETPSIITRALCDPANSFIELTVVTNRIPVISGRAKLTFGSEASLRDGGDGLAELVGDVVFTANQFQITNVKATPSVFGELWRPFDFDDLVSKPGLSLGDFAIQTDPPTAFYADNDPDRPPTFDFPVDLGDALIAHLSASVDAVELRLEGSAIGAAQRKSINDVYHCFVADDDSGVLALWVENGGMSGSDPDLGRCWIKEERPVNVVATLGWIPLDGVCASIAVGFGSSTTPVRSLQTFYYHSSHGLPDAPENVALFVPTQSDQDAKVLAQLCVERQGVEIQGQVLLKRDGESFDFMPAIYDRAPVTKPTGPDSTDEDVQLPVGAAPAALDVAHANVIAPESRPAGITSEFVQIGPWAPRGLDTIDLPSIRNAEDLQIGISHGHRRIFVASRRQSKLFAWKRSGAGVYDANLRFEIALSDADTVADAAFLSDDDGTLLVVAEGDFVYRWDGSVTTKISVPDTSYHLRWLAQNGSTNTRFFSASVVDLTSISKLILLEFVSNQIVKRAEQAIAAFRAHTIVRVKFTNGSHGDLEGIAFQTAFREKVHLAIPHTTGFDRGTPVEINGREPKAIAAAYDGSTSRVAITWHDRGNDTYSTKIYLAEYLLSGGHPIPSLTQLPALDVSHGSNSVTCLSMTVWCDRFLLAVAHGTSESQVFDLDDINRPIAAPAAEAICLSVATDPIDDAKFDLDDVNRPIAAPGAEAICLSVATAPLDDAKAELLLIVASPAQISGKTDVATYSLGVGCRIVPDDLLPVDRCQEMELTQLVPWRAIEMPQILHYQGDGPALLNPFVASLELALPLELAPYLPAQEIPNLKVQLAPLLAECGTSSPIHCYRSDLWLTLGQTRIIELRTDTLFVVTRSEPFVGLLYDQTTLASDANDQDKLRQLTERLQQTAQSAGWYGPTIWRTLDSAGAATYAFLVTPNKVSRATHAQHGGLKVVSARIPAMPLDPRIAPFEISELVHLPPWKLNDHYQPVSQYGLEERALPQAPGDGEPMRRLAIRRRGSNGRIVADDRRIASLLLGATTAWSNDLRQYEPANPSVPSAGQYSFLPWGLQFLFGSAKPGAAMHHRIETATRAGNRLEMPPPLTMALRDPQQFEPRSAIDLTLTATMKDVMFDGTAITDFRQLNSDWTEVFGRRIDSAPPHIDDQTTVHLWPGPNDRASDLDHLIVEIGGAHFIGKRYDDDDNPVENLRVFAILSVVGEQVVESPRYERNGLDIVPAAGPEFIVERAAGETKPPRVFVVTRVPDLLSPAQEYNLDNPSVPTPTARRFSPMVEMTDHSGQTLISPWPLDQFLEEILSPAPPAGYYVFGLKDDHAVAWNEVAAIRIYWEWDDGMGGPLIDVSPWSSPIPVRVVAPPAVRSLISIVLTYQEGSVDRAQTLLHGPAADASKAVPALSIKDQLVLFSMSLTESATVVFPLSTSCVPDRVRLIKSLSAGQVIGAETAPSVLPLSATVSNRTTEIESLQTTKVVTSHTQRLWSRAQRLWSRPNDEGK